MYTDSDELPRPEVLTFLKLYDGLPHITALSYTWAIYGFFWQVDPRYVVYICFGLDALHMFRVHGHGKSFEKAAVTVQFFKDFYNYDASHIRTDEYKVLGLEMMA